LVFIKTVPLKKGFTMSERQTYSTTLNIELITEIRELAQRKTKHQNDLIEEAIQDVLKKYKNQNRLESSFTGLFLLQTLPKNTKQHIH
jgi:metal-responsive CopG/Arc/MetJ family transcriptional regulator